MLNPITISAETYTLCFSVHMLSTGMFVMESVTNNNLVYSLVVDKTYSSGTDKEQLYHTTMCLEVW